MNKKNFGKQGEDLAKNYLLRRGYVFVDENYFSRFGEIDLIMMDGSVLVFCEIKIRRSFKFGTSIEAITDAKRLRLRKTAYVYLAKLPATVPWRIDVVGIDLIPGVIKPKITHIENAF